jgi:hypothetical protein
VDYRQSKLLEPSGSTYDITRKFGQCREKTIDNDPELLSVISLKDAEGRARVHFCQQTNRRAVPGAPANRYLNAVSRTGVRAFDWKVSEGITNQQTATQTLQSELQAAEECGPLLPRTPPWRFSQPQATGHRPERSNVPQIYCGFLLANSSLHRADAHAEPVDRSAPSIRLQAGPVRDEQQWESGCSSVRRSAPRRAIGDLER